MFPTHSLSHRADAASRRAVAEPCEARILLAASVVTDLTPTPADSYPAWVTDLGGVALFAATTTGTGRELWRSDGTPGGTTLVKDVRPGPLDSDPESLVNNAGTLFFIATGDYGIKELWKSDGTAAGTVRVSNRVNLWESSYRPSEQRLVAFNGAVYFRGRGADGGVELWRSDGTDAGTVRLRDINPGAGDSTPAGFTEVGGRLYFTADDGAHGLELWATDGTAPGTVMFQDIRPGPMPSYPSSLTRANGLLFFLARGADNPPSGASALWRSDGTDAGTFAIAYPDGHGFAELKGAGDTLFFTSHTSFGNAVWMTKGTTEGTVRLADFRSFDPGYGYASDLIDVNGTVFFRVLRAGGPGDLWKSDGTPGGTVRLESFTMPSEGLPIDKLSAAGGRVFFSTSTPDNGMELWTTDGTPGGARLVKDLAPGPEGSYPYNFFTVGGTAFFSSSLPATGRELWRSDGTSVGTVLVRDIDPGTRSSDPHDLADVNGTLFFGAGSTYKVKPTHDGAEVIFPGYGLGNLPTDLTGSGNVLYFGSYQIGPFGGPWLMKSDGTPQGTVEVNSELWVHWITDLDHNGTVLFATGRFGGSAELWRSDGTAAGTVPVKDIRPGDGASDPRHLLNVNGTVYFSADDGAAGRELWKSDGTAAGTLRVKDIVPGEAGSDPQGLVAVGGRVYFRVTLPGGATELWKSDGTEAGTARVAAVGAVPLAIMGLFAGGDWQRGAALGSLLIFAASDPAGGVELWRSDGTEGGTYRLADIDPGAGSSDPMWFAAFGGKVYFGASDGATGRELWATDGAAAVRVQDLHPGVPSSDPAWLTVSGDALWFSAVSPLHGRELWKFTADAPPPDVRVVDRHVFYNNSSADGGDPAANAADDAAIDRTKRPLLPGERANSANVTGYSRGINGVMVDLSTVPAGRTPAADDFDLHVGNGITWTALATAPAVAIRRGAGTGGADRVTLTLPDGLVKNTWLRVTVRANADTGLRSPDVFYVGNLVGDVGGNSSSGAMVDRLDLARVRSRLGATSGAARAVFDLNRDGVVNAEDYHLVRANQGRRLAFFTAVA